jgi:hypothetical protein
MPTPTEYIDALPEPRRSELRELDAFIRATLPDAVPHVESGMLGYGRYHFHYASGREGEASLIALASRKQAISLYVCSARDGQYVPEIYADRLPKASVGRSCIRVQRAADLDRDVLAELLLDAERTGGAGAT